MSTYKTLSSNELNLALIISSASVTLSADLDEISVPPFESVFQVSPDQAILRALN